MGSNDLGGVRGERGREMEQNRTTSSPDTEATEVFEEMGLATPDQRDEVLAQGSIDEPDPDVRYIIVLSNSSRPAPTVG